MPLIPESPVDCKGPNSAYPWCFSLQIESRTVSPHAACASTDVQLQRMHTQTHTHACAHTHTHSDYSSDISSVSPIQTYTIFISFCLLSLSLIGRNCFSSRCCTSVFCPPPPQRHAGSGLLTCQKKPDLVLSLSLYSRFSPVRSNIPRESIC